MDSFTQVAAYLQPSLESVAKLASIIPLWLLLIMADKHLLGLPLFEGSLWRSPRIPPRFNIKGGHGGEYDSRSNFGRHSSGSDERPVHGEEAAPFGPSRLKRAFAECSTLHRKPSHVPAFLSDSSPSWASGTTALSLYQPLEVHDPFNTSSPWLEPCYVGTAVLLVLAFAFLRTITNGHWSPFGKNKASQARKTSNVETLVPDPVAGQQVTEQMEFPVCWESNLEAVGLAYAALATIPDRINDPTPPPQSLGNSTVISVQVPPSVQAPPPPPPFQMSSFSTDKLVQTPPSVQATPPPPQPPPQSLSLSTVTSIQTSPPAPVPPYPPPTLNLPAISSVDRVPLTPVRTSPGLGRSMVTCAHPTPSAPASAPPVTHYPTPAENVQGSLKKSRGVNESTDSVHVGIAASKKRGGCDRGRKKPEKKEKNENVKFKSDAAITEQEREERNNGSKKNESEAGQEDVKEDREEQSKVEIDVSESGEVLEHDGLDGAPAVVEGKKKKHNMRQNKKRSLRRAAAAAAAEDTGEEVGEAPNAYREDTEDCGGKEEKAKEVGGASEASQEDTEVRGEKEGNGLGFGKEEEANGKNDASNAVELQARDPPDTGPSEAPEAKKKPRRRRGRKHEVKDQALHDVDHEPTTLQKIVSME